MKGITSSVKFFFKTSHIDSTSFGRSCGRSAPSLQVALQYGEVLFPILYPKLTQRHFLVLTLFSFCSSSFLKQVSYSQYFSSTTGVLIYSGSVEKRKFIFPTSTVVTTVMHSLVASSISACLSGVQHLCYKILPYFNRR